MSYTIPQLMLLFFAYAFLGWCVEVAFAACYEGRFVNRGFLNGPICPVYGFGVLGVVLLLEPFKGNLPLLFLGSLAVTTAIEFITGFVLERVFHAKWWDYSDRRLNILGYVCLTFSLVWGGSCVAVVRWIHPLLHGVAIRMPGWLTAALLSVFFCAMMVDIAATLAEIRRLNARLKLLSEMAAEIHALSDEFGQVISDGTLAARSKALAGEEKLSEGMRRLGEMKAETEERIGQGKRAVTEKIDRSRETVSGILDQSKRAMTGKLGQGLDASKRRLSALKEGFANMLEERSFGQNRLLSAFPHLTSHGYQEMLTAMRESYARHRASWMERKGKED